MDVTAEIYNVTARKLEFTLPGWGSWWGGSTGSGAVPIRVVQPPVEGEQPVVAPPPPPGTLPSEVVLNKTEHKAQYYNITIKGLNHVIDAYTAHLVVLKCASNVSTGNCAESQMF